MLGPEYEPTTREVHTRRLSSSPWLNIGCGAVIVFVVAAALFSLFVTNRIIDHGTSDLSNMMQVNLSLIMYTSDNDDLYPGAAHWMDDVYPYSKNEFILHSLAALPKALGHGISKTDPYGIALRKSIAGTSGGLLVRPEEVAVVFDSTTLARNASGELDLLPDPPRHKSDRDNSLFNLIGLFDGHVKPVPKPVVIVR